jgi:hypothetical protein
MSTGYRDKNNKFHPINNKKRMKKERQAKRYIGVGIKLGKPKSPAEKLKMDTKIKADISSQIAFRKELVDKNEELFQKIESGAGEGETSFTSERREQFKDNRDVIKGVEKDIKRNIKRLDKEDRKKLPQNVQNDVRTFR